MDERTSQIRKDIDETRARVGEEVEALSYKTDVGARLDDYVDDKKEAVTTKVKGAKDVMTSTVENVLPSKQRLRSLRTTATQNPLGLAIGGVAAGFLVGLLIPSTKLEDEQLGEMATRLKETAKETGQDALDRGKDVAQSAMQTAKDEGSEQGRELASELKERVQQEAQEEGGASQGRVGQASR